jgi:hypothetical protein
MKRRHLGGICWQDAGATAKALSRHFVDTTLAIFDFRISLFEFRFSLFVLGSKLDKLPLGEAIDQLAVRFQKVVLRKLAARRPLYGLKHLVANLTAVVRYREENHFHVAVGIVVAQAENLPANFRLNQQFFFQFPLQRGWQFFSVFHLATREFPL